MSENQNYFIDNNGNNSDESNSSIGENNSSSDESNSSSDESNTSTMKDSDNDESESSSSDDSIFLGDINELLESEIHPQFREMAFAIRNDDAYVLNVVLDNFNGNIDENLIIGQTALSYACNQFSLSCFKLLLARGANLEAKNNLGSIPLHISCGLGLFRITKIILNYSTDQHTINRMVQSVNNFGATPLHEAVVGCNINVIKLLLNIGVTSIDDGINKLIGYLDKYGSTPLHIAAEYGNAKVVKLLLEFGSSTQIRNFDGQIPWDLAKPNSEIRRILEEYDEN